MYNLLNHQEVIQFNFEYLAFLPMLTSKDLQSLLPSFIDHLSATNSSRSTIKNYASDLKTILEKLPADLEIGQDSLNQAIATLRGQFSESTLRRFGYSLKSFCSWLNSRGYSLTTTHIPQKISEHSTSSPIEVYSEHIKAEGAASSTAKLYTAAVASFFAWLRPDQDSVQTLSQKNIDKVSHNDIERYISYLRSKQTSESTIQSQLYSLKSFFNLHKEDIVYETNPVTLTRPGLVNGARFWQKFKVKKPRIWHAYRGHPMSDYVNWAASAGALLIVGLLIFEGFFAPKPIDIENLKTDIQKGLVLAATPPRILSFQGRLTNPSGTPVTIATNIVFRIWDQVSGGTEGTCAGGGGEDCFWKSKTWSVTPDANGIFSVQLGDTGQSDTAIPASLFSDNASLFLGVTIGADAEATPRQQIASSSYALNSDSLDGIDSLSFLRSDASDSFTGANTLTIADAATFTVDAGTINIGNATGDTITVNGTPTFNTDTNFTLAGTENIAMTSDLAGTVDVISIIGTPSSSAGTTQGLFIQQAASANTNGLDVGIKIDNADTDLLLSDAISITNTGGGGNGYTNFLNTPTIDITGAGAITGATGLTSSGTITFSSMITDANAVLYTDTSGVVTRVVETETGSQCLVSGAGASGIPSWGSCGAGGFSGEVDDTTNDSLTFTSDDASPPAGTVNSIFRDNTGDLNINTITGKTLNLQIAGADEFNISSTGIDFNTNSITDLGSITSPSGANTYSFTSTNATGTTFNLVDSSLSTGFLTIFNSSNNSAANTEWIANRFQVTNSQGTTAVSSGSIVGAEIRFQQFTSVAGNNETAFKVYVSQMDFSSTDATVNNLINLANSDTATGNQITVTDAIKIDGANIVTGINIGSGTLTTAIDLSGASTTTDLILDDGLTIAQTSDNDFDLVENSLTLNADFGETVGSTIILGVNTSGQSLALATTGGGAQVTSISSAGTGVNALDFNASAGGLEIDAVTQLSLDITSATAASNISVAANADAEDLTVEVTGSAGDLILSSVDQITLDGVLLSLDATTSSNLTVTGSGQSLTVSATGGGAQELILSSAGTGTAAINMDVSGTGGDLDIDVNDAITVDAATMTFTLAAGTTDFTIAGLDTDSNLILSGMGTDANAVLYTTTGGVVTRVVETETGSQCLLSGAGASGVPVWGACSGGAFSGEVDDTTNDSLTFTSDDASPPAGTVNSIFRDNTGDLNINTVTGKTLNIQIAGADEFNFSDTAFSLNGNNITTNAASDFVLAANTASAFDFTDGTNAYQTIDTRTTASGVSALSFATGTAPTIASGASTFFNSVKFTPGTVNFTGTTQITSTGTSANNALLFNQPTISGNNTFTIDQASNLFINGATIASSSAGTETITVSSGLRIGAGSALNGTNGAVTRGYGLYVDAPTGAGANYAATFATGNVGIGSTTPANKLYISTDTNADGAYVNGSANPSFTLLTGGTLRGLFGAVTTVDAYSIGSVANDIAYQTKGGALHFNTNSGAGGASLFLAGANGNIGIDTTGPNSKLHIVGGVCIESSDSGCTIASGNLGVNGGTISSSTTLTLDATSTVIIPDADTFQTNDVTSTSGLTLGTGSNGNITLTPNGSGDVVVSGDAGSNLQVTFGEAPGVDMTAISNATFGATATTIDGLQIDFETAGTTASADNAGLRINVTSNNSGTTTTLEGIYIGNLASAEANSTETALRIGTGWDSGVTVESGGITISGGNLVYSGSSQPTRKVTLTPEYAGAVLTGTGSGSMTSDFCEQGVSTDIANTNTTICENGQIHNYYSWTSTSGSNTYSLYVRWRIPDNFAGWGTSGDPIKVWGRVSDSTDGSVTVYTYDTAGTAENAGTAVDGATNTWTQTSLEVAPYEGTYTTGSYMTFKIDLQVTGTDTAQVGEIDINYLSNN